MCDSFNICIILESGSYARFFSSNCGAFVFFNTPCNFFVESLTCIIETEVHRALLWEFVNLAIDCAFKNIFCYYRSQRFHVSQVTLILSSPIYFGPPWVFLLWESLHFAILWGIPTVETLALWCCDDKVYVYIGGGQHSIISQLNLMCLSCDLLI